VMAKHDAGCANFFRVRSIWHRQQHLMSPPVAPPTKSGSGPILNVQWRASRQNPSSMENR